jgi:hypothetical protein
MVQRMARSVIETISSIRVKATLTPIPLLSEGEGEAANLKLKGFKVFLHFD